MSFYLKKPLCAYLLLTDLENMEGKSASCCQVGQMAFTSVVVFNFFICCRDGNKTKLVKHRVQMAKAKDKRVGV